MIPKQPAVTRWKFSSLVLLVGNLLISRTLITRPLGMLTTRCVQLKILIQQIISAILTTFLNLPIWLEISKVKLKIIKTRVYWSWRQLYLKKVKLFFTVLNYFEARFKHWSLFEGPTYKTSNHLKLIINCEAHRIYYWLIYSVQAGDFIEINWVLVPSVFLMSDPLSAEVLFHGTINSIWHQTPTRLSSCFPAEAITEWMCESCWFVSRTTATSM